MVEEAQPTSETCAIYASHNVRRTSDTGQGFMFASHLVLLKIAVGGRDTRDDALRKKQYDEGYYRHGEHGTYDLQNAQQEGDQQEQQAG